MFLSKLEEAWSVKNDALWVLYTPLAWAFFIGD
jgi:hypothetical protein